MDEKDESVSDLLTRGTAAFRPMLAKVRAASDTAPLTINGHSLLRRASDGKPLVVGDLRPGMKIEFDLSDFLVNTGNRAARRKARA